MKHTRFKDCLHYLLGYLGIHTEYSDRIETETRLRLLLTNQSPYKIESYKGQVKIIKVADWAEVYVLFCSLVGHGKIETNTKERGCLFTANGLSLECFCSNRRNKYWLCWDEGFRIKDSSLRLEIITLEQSRFIRS